MKLIETRNSRGSRVNTESYVAERYQLLTKASVELPIFHAVHPQTKERCIVKFGSPKSFLLSETVDMFRKRLAQEAAKLERWSPCPNVVRLLDSHVDAEQPFLVLEALGISLDEAIPEGGLALQDSLVVLRDVAAAVTAIHGLSDCHGDIKPENILKHSIKNVWTLIDPASIGLSTDEFSSEHLSGWEQDILSLGRTFIVAYTGAIDTQLDEFIREGLERDEPDLVHLLDRMLQPRPAVKSTDVLAHPTG